MNVRPSLVFGLALFASDVADSSNAHELPKAVVNRSISLQGTIISAEEGPMEGVWVSAKKRRFDDHTDRKQ